MEKQRDYNFNSIGDLLDYRKYLQKEIRKYEKYVYFIPSSYIFYVRYCFHMLKLVNILIKKNDINNEFQCKYYFWF